MSGHTPDGMRGTWLSEGMSPRDVIFIVHSDYVIIIQEIRNDEIRNDDENMMGHLEEMFQAF